MQKRSNQFSITKDCGQPKSSMVFTLMHILLRFLRSLRVYRVSFLGRLAFVFWADKCVELRFRVLTEFSIINNIYEADKCVAASIYDSAYYIALSLDSTIFFYTAFAGAENRCTGGAAV